MARWVGAGLAGGIPHNGILGATSSVIAVMPHVAAWMPGMPFHAAEVRCLQLHEAVVPIWRVLEGL